MHCQKSEDLAVLESCENAENGESSASQSNGNFNEQVDERKEDDCLATEVDEHVRSTRANMRKKSTFASVKSIAMSFSSMSSRLVGPKDEPFPLPPTVLWSVIFFILFLGFGLVAAHLPSEGIRVIFLGVCLLLAVVISIMLGKDFVSNDISKCTSNSRQYVIPCEVN